MFFMSLKRLFSRKKILILLKNIVGTLSYFTGKTMGVASGDADKDASTLFGQVEFFF